MANTRLFQATRDFEDGVAAHLDLLYPLVAGLWGLRIQLAGYLAHNPDASESDLQARLLTGSGIRGTGLRGVLRRDWDEQRAATGALGLIAVIALYETWADRMAARLPKGDRKRTASALQWPPKHSNPMAKPPAGADEALAAFRVLPPTYPRAMRALANSTSQHNVVPLGRLPALLAAYRAFKERRNVIAHSGAVAEPFTVLWDRHAAALSPSDLGLKYSVRLGGLVQGARTGVDVRQVSGLIKILLQVTATVDRDAAFSSAGELEVLDRFPGSPRAPMRVHETGADRDRTRGIPGPTAMSDVTAMLQAVRVVV